MGVKTLSSASGAAHEEGTDTCAWPPRRRGALRPPLCQGPDYDGGNKAWVRFADSGEDAVVGGSQVKRGQMPGEPTEPFHPEPPGRHRAARDRPVRGDGRPGAAQAHPRPASPLRGRADAGLSVGGEPRKDIGDDAFRELARGSIDEFGSGSRPRGHRPIRRQTQPRRHHEGPEALAAMVEGPRGDLDGNPRLLHYLSVPPSATCR